MENAALVLIVVSKLSINSGYAIFCEALNILPSSPHFPVVEIEVPLLNATQSFE
jgi:hypothetical protein